MKLDSNILQKKQQRLQKFRPFPQEIDKNLYEWFKVELTFTSNAIEGNTLSRAETALVVEKGLTVEGKTLQEYLEAVNHASAVDWVTNHAKGNRKSVTEKMILSLHAIILQKIDDKNAGCYRTVPVRIAGSTVIMPNSAKVPQLMQEFIAWLQVCNDDPITVALEAHLKFVSIHPFTDGNGRTARLLMNLLLQQAGYPPAIIPKEDRMRYIKSIEKIQLGGSRDEYTQLMYEAVNRSLDVYFEAFEGEKLMAIGKLAKETGESVPTIRYWTKEGLLKIEDYTPGGYQLYSKEMIQVAKKIRVLQKEKRLTIGEIKKEINK